MKKEGFSIFSLYFLSLAFPVLELVWLGIYREIARDLKRKERERKGVKRRNKGIRRFE